MQTSLFGNRVGIGLRMSHANAAMNHVYCLPPGTSAATDTTFSFEELMEELRVAEEALSRLVAPDLDGDLPGFDDMRRLVDTWVEAIGAGDILRQRDVLRDLVETVEPVRVGRGSYAVRIGWTRLGEKLHFDVFGVL